MFYINSLEIYDTIILRYFVKNSLNKTSESETEKLENKDWGGGGGEGGA